jgi:cytochrome c oxidase cbb3-type subunit 3
MTLQTDEKLTDHAYDDIQEYDNPTPGWWVLVFVISVIFSIGYGVYYHLSKESTSVRQGYEKEVAANLIKKFGKMGTLKQDQNALLGYMQNPEYVMVGESVFKQQCAGCHATDGSGLTGPNMTDDHYKNVRVLGDLLKVINNGAAQGSMPPQRGNLHPNEVALVAAYVANIRGKNLPGKPAEGNKIDPWPAAPPKPASAPATDAK